MNTKPEKKREPRLNIRISEAVRMEFHAAAIAQDQKASWLLHRFIAQTIRKAKAEYPERFQEELENIRASEGVITEPAVAANGNDVELIDTPLEFLRPKS